MSGKPSGVGFGHRQAPWDVTGGRSPLYRSSEKKVVCTREGREGKATGKCKGVIEIHQGSQPGMEWGHHGRTWVLGSRRLQQQGDGEHRSCRDQTTRRALTARRLLLSPVRPPLPDARLSIRVDSPRTSQLELPPRTHQLPPGRTVLVPPLCRPEFTG